MSKQAGVRSVDHDRIEPLIASSSRDLGIFFQHARFQPEISNTKLSRITFGNLFPQIN